MRRERRMDEAEFIVGCGMRVEGYGRVEDGWGEVIEGWRVKVG